MRFYSTETIRKIADCSEIAEKMFGAAVKNGRCAATWRGGDNAEMVHIDREKWFDHKQKGGGGCFELVMAGKNCSFHEAVEILGDFYRLDRDVELKDKVTPKPVAEWVYTDADGNPAHKTVRLEPGENGEGKTFRQYHWNGKEWVKGLNSHPTYPLYLTEWKDSPWVIINEGEKCCDVVRGLGLPSTTFPMGADKWKPEWAKWFNDKQIAILRDNDDAGNEHGARLAWELRNTAKNIKLLTPSKISKGDAWEYIHQEGGTKDSLLTLIKQAKALHSFDITEPQSSIDSKEETAAKEANKEEFRNYHIEDTGETDKKGNKIYEYPPKKIKSIIKELGVRMMNFPIRCGGVLIDIDKKTGEVIELRNSDDLQARLSLVTGHNPKFKEGKANGYVPMQILFNALHQTTKNYELLSNSPHFPYNENTYYHFGTLPSPTEDAAYFNKFCTLFCPASYADALMIKCCVASLFYWQDKVDKPMWIIDTADGSGQGTGKTKLVEVLAALINSEPLWISPNVFKTTDALYQLNRRILSTEGRHKRVFLIDNVTKFFESPDLASFVTQGSFAGIAPYGKGECNRANDLSFFITSNGGTFDKDIIDRSLIIHLEKKEKREERWILNTMEFIKNHRLQIYSDIIHLLSKPATTTGQCRTRFRVWERDIMFPILRDMSDHKDIMSVTNQRKDKADGDKERAETLKDYFYNRIISLNDGSANNINPDTHYIWIESHVLSKWSIEAIPGFGGNFGGHATHILRQMYKTGIFPELSAKFERWPLTDSPLGRTRGMFWNGDKFLLECVGKTKAEKYDIQRKVLIVKLGNEGRPFVQFTDIPEESK